MNRSNDLPGYFGGYGGRYVPEMLMPALSELEEIFNRCCKNSDFEQQISDLHKNYCGRPTPLYEALNLSRHLGGCRIFLKLEGLAHTGAHKINNALGQALLAKALGKRKLIAETGAGQHGVATATVAAVLGFECKVFMGAEDMRRQHPNVFLMELLGAKVVPVNEGTRTLKDAVNVALKYWMENLSDTHYLIGSAVGPHPYPTIVRYFQSVIGRETREQIYQAVGRLPDYLLACVGGGSNALGLFNEFLGDNNVAMIGVEAGGRGDSPGDNAVRFGKYGRPGVAQGYRSFFLQDENGQVMPTHSISAGLDYPGIGPELAYLRETKKVKFEKANNTEALQAVTTLAKLEGIIPALESAHAVAFACKIAPKIDKDKIMVINISGRGDKDLFITARALDGEKWIKFLQEETNRAI
jgi:tryptophan synthase beta chain